jgi:hypothetical protein
LAAAEEILLCDEVANSCRFDTDSLHDRNGEVVGYGTRIMGWFVRRFTTYLLESINIYTWESWIL